MNIRALISILFLAAVLFTSLAFSQKIQWHRFDRPFAAEIINESSDDTVKVLVIKRNMSVRDIDGEKNLTFLLPLERFDVYSLVHAGWTDVLISYRDTVAFRVRAGKEIRP